MRLTARSGTMPVSSPLGTARTHELRLRGSRARCSMCATLCLAPLVVGAALAARPTTAEADHGELTTQGASTARTQRGAKSRRARDAVRVPDDVRYGQQWQFAENGALGAPRAWSIGRGGAVTVAVVDSGMDMTHPDLWGNLWTNSHEIAGNGIDDDGDGYVDDAHGWDFLSRDGDPSDDNGHGTSIAGIVAARGDNGIGVTGVAWRARIMPLKVTDAQGTASFQAVAEAIRYAVAHGARIVLLALAGDEPNLYLHDAVRAASESGALLVCAAGNSGRDVDVQPAYPASFDDPNVLSVGATAHDGSLTAGSNRGQSVDIAAPGEGIVSTARGDGYERDSGTSMAAATVAGALALMSAAAPDLDAGELRDALLGTARSPGSMPIGGGSLDLAAAMQRVTGLTR